MIYDIFLVGILNQFSVGFMWFVEDSFGGDVWFGVYNLFLGCILQELIYVIGCDGDIIWI